MYHEELWNDYKLNEYLAITWSYLGIFGHITIRLAIDYYIQIV
jgi:hypothetical protein